IGSPDYPLPARRGGWDGWRAITMPFKLRPAAFDTVADILLLLDYLDSRPDVAKTRLFLVGSSLGAPAVAIAGGIDARPAAVVALYGGGKIGALVSHALTHPDQPPPQRHDRHLAYRPRPPPVGRVKEKWGRRSEPGWGG